MGKGHEIALLLRRSHWAVHRRTDAALKGERVTANQFVLLSLLAERDGIRQHELVERASSDANTVRAMLVVLERDGLVTRMLDRRDRRARLVRLSAAGRRVFRRACTATEPVRKRLLRTLPPGDAPVLVGWLDRLHQAMRPENDEGRVAGGGRSGRRAVSAGTPGLRVSIPPRKTRRAESAAHPTGRDR